MKKLKHIRQNINHFLIKHKRKLDALADIARSATNYAINKNPISFAEGGINAIQSYFGSDIYHIDSFFTEDNGWKILSLNGIDNFNLFHPLIKSMSSNPIPLKDVYNIKASGILIDMPYIGFVEYSGSSVILYYKFDNITAKEICDFLIENELKRLNSKIFSLAFNDNEGNDFSFRSEKLSSIKSIKSEYYTKFLKTYFDAGLSRSILFYGPPGTGKTTLAETVITNLGLITLKFRYTNYFDIGTIKFIIDNFNIEAIIMDDFDQIDNSNALLEFLEYAASKCKLLIGLANSLEDFHPALLRPKRFDEIILIDTLEKDTIKEVLGDLYSVYGSKTSHWPIAFLNELKIKQRFHNKKELEAIFKSLDKRVNDQMRMLQPASSGED